MAPPAYTKQFLDFSALSGEKVEYTAVVPVGKVWVVRNIICTCGLIAAPAAFYCWFIPGNTFLAVELGGDGHSHTAFYETRVVAQAGTILHGRVDAVSCQMHVAGYEFSV